MSAPTAIDFTAIKALSFDLDDTLWDIRPIIKHAEHSSRTWLLEQFPDTKEFFANRSVLDLRSEVFADHPDRHFDLSFLRKECIGRILETSGYSRDGVEDAFAVFKHARDTIELFDDVMPFFNRLKEHVPTLALTNGNASLDRTPLKNRFHTYLTAAIVGAAKPEPKMFSVALNTHGLAPHEMLHIGDDLHTDVGGAASRGIPTVWINRYSRTWNPDSPRPSLVANTLAQLATVLEVHTDLLKVDDQETNA